MLLLVYLSVIAEANAYMPYFPALPRSGQVVDRLFGAALAANSVTHPIPLELNSDAAAGKDEPREFISAEGGQLIHRVRGDEGKSSLGGTTEAESSVGGSEEEEATESEELETVTIETNKSTPIASTTTMTTTSTVELVTPKRSLYGEPSRVDGKTNVSKGYQNVIIDNEAVVQIPTTGGAVVNVDVANETTIPTESGCFSENTTDVTVGKTESNVLPSGVYEQATIVTTIGYVTEANNIQPSYNVQVDTTLQNETGTDLGVEADYRSSYVNAEKPKGDYPNEEDYDEDDIKDAHQLLDAINLRFRNLFHALKSQLSKQKQTPSAPSDGYVTSNNATEVSPSRKRSETMLQRILEKPLHLPNEGEWHKYEMNCEREEDGYGKQCEEWVEAGLCLSNAATRFLWCRRTCLCVGPSPIRSF